MLSWRKRRAAKREILDQISRMELITPSHFRCPISLELMKDPVTLLTGITYDRDNIEKWIEAGNHTCPVTNQALRSLDLIPNHTLRKMIQEWSVEKISYGIERIPTPKIPVSSYEVLEVLSKIEGASDQKDQDACRDLMVKVKGLAKESERNKRCILGSGASRVIAASFEAFSKTHMSLETNVGVLEEILFTLTSIFLPLDDEARSFLGSAPSLSSMTWLLKSGSLSGRRNAVLALVEIVSSDDHEKTDRLVRIKGVLEALFKLIKESISPTTTKASLLLIYHLISKSSSANVVSERFAEMGLVELLLELLIDSENSICEKALGVLNEICSSSTEGRKRAYAYALTVPVLVKKILRISDLATQLSVSILLKLVKTDEREESVHFMIEALQLGAFQKLLLLLQVGCSETTKEKSSELLKLLNMYRDRAECVDSLDFKNLKRAF